MNQRGTAMRDGVIWVFRMVVDGWSGLLGRVLSILRRFRPACDSRSSSGVVPGRISTRSRDVTSRIRVGPGRVDLPVHEFLLRGPRRVGGGRPPHRRSGYRSCPPRAEGAGVQRHRLAAAVGQSSACRARRCSSAWWSSRLGPRVTASEIEAFIKEVASELIAFSPKPHSRWSTPGTPPAKSCRNSGSPSAGCRGSPVRSGEVVMVGHDVTLLECDATSHVTLRPCGYDSLPS